MKKPHILNRPMFKVEGNSAYGTGIASNLVNNEQRIRFNQGGRVPAQWGLYAKAAPYAQKLYKPLKSMAQKFWKDSPDWMPKTYGLGKTPGIGGRVLAPVSKYGTVPYGAGVATSGIGEDRDFSFNPLDWIGLGGKEEEETTETVTLTEDEQARLDKQNKLLGMKDPTTEDLKKTTTETETIDLTPSEREGLKASMMFGAGTGALSAKGDVLDVVKGALLGAAGEGAKGVSPIKEKEYRLWGEAQSQRDIDKMKAAAKITGTPEARLDKAMLAKLDPVEALNYAYKTEIKKVSPKIKPDKAGKIRTKEISNLEVGDVFYDEDDKKFKHVAGKNAEGGLVIKSITKDIAIKIG